LLLPTSCAATSGPRRRSAIFQRHQTASNSSGLGFVWSILFLSEILHCPPFLSFSSFLLLPFLVHHTTCCIHPDVHILLGRLTDTSLVPRVRCHLRADVPKYTNLRSSTALIRQCLRLAFLLPTAIPRRHRLTTIPDY
jgi:hypothetical protein